jgi:hypothetical protein
MYDLIMHDQIKNLLSAREGVDVNVLAIGYLTGKDIQPHIAAEQEAVAKLREEGFIGDVYLKADRTGPVLLLKATDRADARQRLATLPFVTEHLVAFDLVELDSLPANNHPSS